MPAPQIGGGGGAPQIGALAPIASATTGQVSGLGQFGESLANLPDAMAQKQLQRSEVQGQQSTLDDHRLQQITQMAQSNPAYAQHPELIKGVSDIYKRRGLPPPVTTDENGTRLDLNALSPGKQFGQLTEAEKAPYRALDPEQRAAEMQAARIQGAPPEFLKADASVPLAPGAEGGLIRMMTEGLTTLSDPTKDPVLYAPTMLAAKKPLGKMGIDVTQLMGPQIDAALQTRSQNAVAREVAIGLTAPAEAVRRSEALIAYDKGRLANAVNETQIKLKPRANAKKTKQLKRRGSFIAGIYRTRERWGIFKSPNSASRPTLKCRGLRVRPVC